jgi:hypothetical protein
MRLMKMDQDRHDLTDIQTSVSLALDFSGGEHLFLPDRDEYFAEVIDSTKQFD